MWHIQYGGRKVEKSSDVDKNLFLRVFQVFDYESNTKFSKIKMGDPILREKNGKNIQFGIWEFMMSFITNFPKNFRNSRLRIEYGGQ